MTKQPHYFQFVFCILISIVFLMVSFVYAKHMQYFFNTIYSFQSSGFAALRRRRYRIIVLAVCS